MHVNVGACEKRKRLLNPSQQDTEAFVSRLMWVLGTKLWCSGKIENTWLLNHLSSPSLNLDILQLCSRSRMDCQV